MHPSFDCHIRRSADTAMLLTRLHESREDGFEPYLLAAWSPDLEAANALSLAHLAQLLDEPLGAREQRTGRRPTRPAWHCSVVNTTGVPLSDEQWLRLVEDVVDATGIAPDGDRFACRWAALRHDHRSLDIVANVIRQDGRWARIHQDTWNARSSCDHHARNLTAQLTH
ncbi:hypothetical protein SLV14_003573 [Streptomyces sp. Je 1-4]|uniref:hypothetical protein n=1 Tax=Streptomyces TaxID=1883 RepID=UPI0021D9ED2A|nr:MULTISPECIES: hypothetical protein [unclassified Streptomyces]UYB40896.1 hypothetical protein SLV14_003573 [Streptomyces sp. Je 1-4]UZQ37055.1 hypothetical protein SLV14N_003573 [Streptomyces sp. Je 1-4] [Streptomyces sp. Je 1-4 4N24]UZQ44472.1 hypothetical protein SLV14NA_003573 [Streptomyces sp. Je 1-4] [Streptomyces sp. Je 1-4 4N24_ara]